jgi:PhnB protein
LAKEEELDAALKEIRGAALENELMRTNVKPIPDGYHTATPYLVIKDAAKAIAFYKKAFNAVETVRMDGPSGKIMHAEIRIGDSPIMMTEECPEMRGPQAMGGSPVSLMLYVEDVDAVVEQASAAGARILRPVKDQFYGDRLGTVEDPFGHTWHIATHIEDLAPEEIKRRGAEMCAKQQTADASA